MKKMKFVLCVAAIYGFGIGSICAQTISYKLTSPGTESGWDCNPANGNECIVFTASKATYDTTKKVFSFSFSGPGNQQVVFPSFVNHVSQLTKTGKNGVTTTMTATYSPVTRMIDLGIVSNGQDKRKNPRYLLQVAQFSPK